MWNVTNIALDRSIASSLSHKTCSGQAALTIGAVGVVLGNIGTSPLYAVDQIFYGPAHLAPTPDNVLGCISLAIWALTLIVSLKYAIFILRADNDGEGGVFALYSLLHNYREEAAYLPLLLAGLMLGAGFLCGETIISPAISVLAALAPLDRTCRGRKAPPLSQNGSVRPSAAQAVFDPASDLTTGLLFLRHGRQCPVVRTNHARAPEVSHRPSTAP